MGKGKLYTSRFAPSDALERVKTKTLLKSGCTNQRGAGQTSPHSSFIKFLLRKAPERSKVGCLRNRRFDIAGMFSNRLLFVEAGIRLEKPK